MNILTINPMPALEALIKGSGIANAVYADGVPTSNLPDSFISLMQNGSIKSSASKTGILGCLIAVSLNTKLLNGTTNIKLESFILTKLSGLFGGDDGVATSGIYHYSLNLSNLMYSGRSVAAGYATRIINLQVKIY